MENVDASDVAALVVGGASLLGIHLAATIKAGNGKVAVADRLATLVVSCVLLVSFVL